MVFKYITAMSLGIGMSAFLFQTAVLYPWHLEVSHEIDTLTKDTKVLNDRLKAINEEKRKL